MKTIAVLDGDIIAYRCAAANEARSIKVVHKMTGQTTEHAHRTAFKEHIRGSFEASEFDITDVQTPESVSFAFHAMNTTMDALKKSCEADSVELYISGDIFYHFTDTVEGVKVAESWQMSNDGKLEGITIVWLRSMV